MNLPLPEVPCGKAYKQPAAVVLSSYNGKIRGGQRWIWSEIRMWSIAQPMRSLGLSYGQISTVLGVCRQTAWYFVNSKASLRESSRTSQNKYRANHPKCKQRCVAYYHKHRAVLMKKMNLRAKALTDSYVEERLRARVGGSTLRNFPPAMVELVRAHITCKRRLKAVKSVTKGTYK